MAIGFVESVLVQCVSSAFVWEQHGITKQSSPCDESSSSCLVIFGLGGESDLCNPDQPVIRWERLLLQIMPSRDRRILLMVVVVVVVAVVEVVIIAIF